MRKTNDRFTEKELKVYKTFKVRSVKTPKLDVPPKETTYNRFYKDLKKKKEELKGIYVSHECAIILRE